MPEHVSGPFGDPSRGDSEQPSGDALARIEQLERVVAELITQLADEARAEEILRRAAAPVSPRRPARPRRRGDTFLRVVRAAIIAAVSLGVVVALLQPARVRQARWTPQCVTQCARPVAHHSQATPR